MLPWPEVAASTIELLLDARELELGGGRECVEAERLAVRTATQ